MGTLLIAHRVLRQTTFAVAQWISSLAGRRMAKQGMTKAVGSVPQVQQRKPSSQPHFLNSVPQGAREFQKSVRRRLSQMLQVCTPPLHVARSHSDLDTETSPIRR